MLISRGNEKGTEKRRKVGGMSYFPPGPSFLEQQQRTAMAKMPSAL